MNESVFLGEHGITSTQGNYLANLAQELIVKDKELLEEATFYNSFVETIGSEAPPKQTGVGKNEDYVKNIPNILSRIAQMNAFCAWMREAIKAKDRLLMDVEAIPYTQWAKELPTTPTYPSILEGKDLLDTLNIKERCEYLTLEAYASAVGKQIHSGGSIHDARVSAHKIAVKPIVMNGSGADALIYTYKPSVDVELVDSTYEKLQNSQRQYEARLNAIKFKLQEKAAEINLKAKETYEKERAEYEKTMARIIADFQAWRVAEKQRISKLKIQIPNELQDTFEYLNSVGNKVADS